jgi:hypothetical protein
MKNVQRLLALAALLLCHALTAQVKNNLNNPTWPVLYVLNYLLKAIHLFV